MKNTMGYARFAFYVLALPLLATAAVSAHQFLLDNTPIKTTGPAVVSGAVSGLTGSFRNHTLAVDEQGGVKGRVNVVNRDLSVSGLSALRVCLVRDGKIEHVVDTNSLGQFEFTGVGEGVYSFVATGKDGFAACGVKVARGEGANTMEVAVVNPDFAQVREIFESTEGVVESATSAGAEQPTRIDGNNRVSMSNGNLVGKLFDFVSGTVSSQTKAYLLKNNQRIAEAAVDAFGQFNFAGVEPGVYEFVAAGPTGYAAVSFEAVAQEAVAAAQVPQPGDVPADAVAAGSVVEEGLAAPAQQLDVPMTAAADHVVVGEQLSTACDACTPGAPVVDAYAGPMVGNDIACGAAAGGCCGATGDWGGYYGGGGCGGGGYGGAGGLAGLGRLAVLGWILTSLFDNIDFDNNEPPPVSPAS
jgi:hypothetical protein